MAACAGGGIGTGAGIASGNGVLNFRRVSIPYRMNGSSASAGHGSEEGSDEHD